ncbi:unnamed protein product [Amoebophrya sp. A25]|nr:unnamed protein product [Amoebophrya sp. A25]|eukprot:GSA25T00026048001.1
MEGGDRRQNHGPVHLLGSRNKRGLVSRERKRKSPHDVFAIVNATTTGRRGLLMPRTKATLRTSFLIILKLLIVPPDEVSSSRMHIHDHDYDLEKEQLRDVDKTAEDEKEKNGELVNQQQQQHINDDAEDRKDYDFASKPDGDNDDINGKGRHELVRELGGDAKNDGNEELKNVDLDALVEVDELDDEEEVHAHGPEGGKGADEQENFVVEGGNFSQLGMDGGQGFSNFVADENNHSISSSRRSMEMDHLDEMLLQKRSMIPIHPIQEHHSNMNRSSTPEQDEVEVVAQKSIPTSRTSTSLVDKETKMKMKAIANPWHTVGRWNGTCFSHFYCEHGKNLHCFWDRAKCLTRGDCEWANGRSNTNFMCDFPMSSDLLYLCVDWFVRKIFQVECPAGKHYPGNTDVNWQRKFCDPDVPNGKDQIAQAERRRRANGGLNKWLPLECTADRFKKQCCDWNQCNCPGGTPSSQTECPHNNALSCSSCDAGYYKEFKQCKQCERCICPNGTPKTGSSCTCNGAGEHVLCETCKEGFYLRKSDQSCQQCICNCASSSGASIGTAQTGSDCTCDEETKSQTWCTSCKKNVASRNYCLKGKDCEFCKCACRNGTPDAAGLCSVNQEHRCASCDHGFYLKNSDRPECKACNVLQCSNGNKATTCTEASNDKVNCESCKKATDNNYCLNSLTGPGDRKSCNKCQWIMELPMQPEFARQMVKCVKVATLGGISTSMTIINASSASVPVTVVLQRQARHARVKKARGLQSIATRATSLDRVAEKITVRIPSQQRNIRYDVRSVFARVRMGRQRQMAGASKINTTTALLVGRGTTSNLHRTTCTIHAS